MWGGRGSKMIKILSTWLLNDPLRKIIVKMSAIMYISAAQFWTLWLRATILSPQGQRERAVLNFDWAWMTMMIHWTCGCWTLPGLLLLGLFLGWTSANIDRSLHRLVLNTSEPYIFSGLGPLRNSKDLLRTCSEQRTSFDFSKAFCSSSFHP